MTERHPDWKPWKFEPSDPGCGLKTFIGEAVGAASMCWETPYGAGEFDSTRASAIVDAIYERAMSPAGARMGMASTEDLLNELEARFRISSEHLALARVQHLRMILDRKTLDYRTVDSNE